MLSAKRRLFSLGVNELTIRGGMSPAGVTSRVGGIKDGIQWSMAKI